MPTLLEIEDDVMALDALLNDCQGDVSDPKVQAAVDQWFAENEAMLHTKVDGYAALIQEKKLLAEAAKQEAKRMADKAQQRAAAADFLSYRLKGVMERLGLNKIETPRFTVAVQGNGGKQPVDVFGPIDELPEWAKRTKTTIEPDKDKIRERLEAGEKLEFATLMDRGTRLAIR